MAVQLSTYLTNALLNQALHNTAPGTAWGTDPNMALFSAAPTMPTGGTPGGTELVSGTSPGYLRQTCPFHTGAATGSISNSAQVQFTATAAWLQAVAWAVVDSAANTYASDLLQGTNDVWSLVQGGTGLGGTYTITFGGQTTAAIPQLATAAQVQEFLEELSSIGQSNVTVTGTTMTSSGGTYTITLLGTLRWAANGAITGTSSLTGTGATLTLTHSTTGASGAITLPTNGSTITFAIGAIVLSLQ